MSGESVAQRRKQTKNSRRADTFFGYLIPAFFIILACYQQYSNGKIDKYVITAIFIFGLGALGWRIDTLIEKYFDAKSRLGAGPRPSEAEDGNDPPEDPPEQPKKPATPPEHTAGPRPKRKPNLIKGKPDDS
jgi:hypothetical protein